MNLLNLLPIAGKLTALIPWWAKLLAIGVVIAAIYAWDAHRLSVARYEGRLDAQPKIMEKGRIEGR